MPGPINGQAALVNGAMPKTTSAALNQFVEAGKQLAKSFLTSLRNNPPVETRRQEPEGNNANTIQAAAPTRQGAAEPVPNAPAAPAPLNPTANNAKSWLSAECEKLIGALSNRDNNPGNPDNLEGRTQSLYSLALEIKQQIGEHQTGLQALWPEDLRADFEQNIQFIQDHFNAGNHTNNPKISLPEIEFFNAYFNYMKSCLRESHPELSRQLETVEKQIGLLKQDLLKSTSTTKEKLTAAQAKVELAGLEADMTQNHPTRVQAEYRNTLRQKAQKFNGDVAEATQRINELRPAIEQLENVQPPHAESTRQLPIHSVELIKQTQKIEACRLGAEIYGNVETGVLAGNLAVNKLTKEFKETQALAMVSKKADPSWVAASVKLKNQLIQLQANQGHTVEIDDSLRSKLIHDSPDGKITSVEVGQGKTVYHHALHALGFLNNNPQDGAPANPVYTPEEKKLALILIGGWAAQQCTIARDNFGDTYARTQLIMDNAANLLAAKIVSKTDNLDQPATNELKESIAGFINDYIGGEKAGNLNSAIQKLPRSITNCDYAECFTNAVGLQSCLSFKHNTSDAQQLIKYAKTDRTFEKDRSAGLSLKEGQSRQYVLKESMIRAAALMRPETNQDTGETVPDADVSRINHAKNAASPGDDVILARLGLGGEIQPTVLSDELLDQLTMAAVAQNDLSLKENHLHRGSMENKIQRYENRSTVETLKNHNLDNFDDLNRKLINTAIMMRQPVNEAIERTKNSLQQNQHVKSEDIQRLIKQIIITTDSKSALNPQFNLKDLTEAAADVGATNDATNRGRLIDALGNVQLAWRDGEPETRADAAALRPALERWNTADSRSTFSKILTSNPVRSLPFLNRTPLLARLCSASFKLSKALVAVAGTAVVASFTVPIAAAAITSYGIYRGYKAVNR